ncbi:hypothetical protein MVEN_00269900 [Mycena venus]|uniref:Cytochrome P450 n=1 Tax=Mycena venus TaxID=2733690 RepID=A0A8H6YYI8_9AGAR|nr:hypothetical protein MVEN_00269900 [Mycena venus]
MFIKLFLPVAGSLAAYGLYQIFNLLFQELFSPLRHLPGPKCTNFFYGNLKEIGESANAALREQWVQEYGPTLRYRGLFGMTRLYTHDTKALNHFLTHSNIYQKPEGTRYNLSRIVGPGVLVVEGDIHRQQRKIMNPAFGAPQVRELTPIFVEKAMELRDIWASQAAKSSSGVRVDVLSWLNKATLDIIGLAGFNYEFNSLASKTPTELAAAFSDIFESGSKIDTMRILQTRVPAFRFIRTKLDRVIEKSQAVMGRIGLQLLQQSKNEMSQSGTFEKGGRARDLLSLLVRANTSRDIPANQRLSDKDVLAQVPTFLVAGHETTSVGTTWALYALTQNVAAQTRLRNELLAVPTDEPTMDELNALPYLDCVVREALRVHAPVPSTVRVATRDDVVPLAQPFTDIHGTVHETIRVSKGQTIMIPILAMNRDKGIWGPDASEFRPERWESPVSNSLPGIWGHILSFIGGPRACIVCLSLLPISPRCTRSLMNILHCSGIPFLPHRVSSVVHVTCPSRSLLTTGPGTPGRKPSCSPSSAPSSSRLPFPPADVGTKTRVVQRPFIRSEPERGNQMPLLIKPYIRS